MRAGWYERNGAAREVLTIGELPTPQAGPGEVRVRVHASGVNPSDVKRRAGFRGQTITDPRVIPHSDGAGIIDQLGPGVTNARLGERVWLHSAQWQRPFGTAAEHVAVPAALATRLPNNTDFAAGACIGIPVMTAHRCVFADGMVTGRTVLVSGGAGAVGFYAIQLAKWGGARVITTVSSEAKQAAALHAGADIVINYKLTDVAEEIRRAIGPDAVDRIVEVDFGANLPTNLKVLKPGGTIVSYASMAAPEPALPFYGLMAKNVLMRLVLVYNMGAEAIAAACADITRWLESGDRVHQVAAQFPLDQLAAAHEAVEAGNKIGCVVVDLA
ncbi:MAG TPA: NADPH:quinone reductase [Candidatus Sulfotelmatobacter sp.]|nr:NADPH:quinone reductase [Candidatus Sulfotelmatobacter sp.]